MTKTKASGNTWFFAIAYSLLIDGLFASHNSLHASSRSRLTESGMAAIGVPVKKLRAPAKGQG